MMDCQKTLGKDRYEMFGKRVELNKTVRVNTIARESFDKLVVEKENNFLWIKGKNTTNSTVNWLFKQFTKKTDEVETFEGVAISEQEIDKVDEQERNK